jgi:hypothetical protein
VRAPFSYRDGLRPHRDARRPVGVALPVNAPLNARRVEHRPLSWCDLRANHVVGKRGRPRRRPHLRHRHPARVARALRCPRRHPQDQVGEREVGEELPVRHEGVQPLQLWPGQAGEVSCEVGERRHAPMMTRPTWVVSPSFTRTGVAQGRETVHGPVIPRLWCGAGGSDKIAVFAIGPARTAHRGVRGVAPPGINCHHGRNTAKAGRYHS